MSISNSLLLRSLEGFQDMQKRSLLFLIKSKAFESISIPTEV